MKQHKDLFSSTLTIKQYKEDINMNQDFVSRQQLLLLPERIRKAEATNANKEVYKFLWDIFEAKNYDAMKIMVVGAGGSYPAAVSVSHSLRYEMRTPDVEAVTPQTALRILSQTDRILNAEHSPRYDVIIGISYSGKTPDIKAVYENCRSRDLPFVLFTGADKEALKEEYFENEFLKIVSYFNAEDTTGKERGMISMFSTLAPAVLFDYYVDPVYIRWLKEGEQFVSKLNIPKIARAIKRRPIIHVIYEWRTYAIAADIESKFIESGIASVILHEKKNFSHGRYTHLYKQNFAMVINLTKFTVAINTSTMDIELVYDNDYDEKLDKFLKAICEKKKAIYLEMGNSFLENSEMLIKELCKLPYLITAIGEKLGVDISKPFSPDQFPEEPKALYGFDGEF